MKRIILMVVLCAFVLSGCIVNDGNPAVNNTQQNNTGNTQTDTPNQSTVNQNTTNQITANQNTTNQNTTGKASENKEVSVVGLWEHVNYPEAYYIKVNSLEGRVMSLTIEAVRGNYAQIATAEITNAYFVNNKTKFAYEDSFGNTGICDIVINGDEMKVSYKTNTPYKGNWCVDAGEGVYKKASDNSASVKNDSYTSIPANNNTPKENVVSARNYFPSGKYAKVIGYTLGEDVYDKDIYYEFDCPRDGEFLYNNYSNNSYGRDAMGTYKVFSSDKTNYNFKLVFNYEDGHQEVFYVKTVISGTVFDFYREDGTPYNRYERYDDYAVKRTSPDGKTYRFRYDYEYKKYEKKYNVNALQSPFKSLN